MFYSVIIHILIEGSTIPVLFIEMPCRFYSYISPEVKQFPQDHFSILRHLKELTQTISHKFRTFLKIARTEYKYQLINIFPS